MSKGLFIWHMRAPSASVALASQILCWPNTLEHLRVYDVYFFYQTTSWYTRHESVMIVHSDDHGWWAICQMFIFFKYLRILLWVFRNVHNKNDPVKHKVFARFLQMENFHSTELQIIIFVCEPRCRSIYRDRPLSNSYKGVTKASRNRSFTMHKAVESS